MKRSPFLLFLLPTVLFADDVLLKDAGTLSGRIVEQTPTMVTVDIGGGTVSVSMSFVDRIIKARTDLDEYDGRAGRLRWYDLDGWRDLARWASQHGMDGQANQAYEKVLALDPDDPEARDALGFVLLDGGWVTREDAYRARGFVKYEGEWMLPAEAQLRQDSAAAEEARREAERSARMEELEKLKAEVKAAYAAEEAADAEWRAEGAAWFYAQTHFCGGGCYDCPPRWPSQPRFPRHSRN